ncbi:MAG: hypothetical protein GXP48_08340 [Acidobacteria bacterium]|nr:hypothetical protein [Acidobacteriota bacterium]
MKPNIAEGVLLMMVGLFGALRNILFIRKHRDQRILNPGLDPKFSATLALLIWLAMVIGGLLFLLS